MIRGRNAPLFFFWWYMNKFEENVITSLAKIQTDIEWLKQRDKDSVAAKTFWWVTGVEIALIGTLFALIAK